MGKIYKNKLTTLEKSIWRKYEKKTNSKIQEPKHSMKLEKKTKMILKEQERKGLDFGIKNGEQDCLMEFQDLQYDNFYKGLFGKRRPIIT